MNELALFSGVGGGLLGARLLGWRTVCAVEKEPYRREVLLRRQRDGVLPLFPIWDRIETFDGKPWRGKVDIVTAGFPCQPFSAAGRRRGADDKRNLWPETIRCIREVRPQFVLLENVPPLRCPDRKGKVEPAYFGRVVSDLAESGFLCRWDCLPASACGAPHQRDRLWVIAYAVSGRSGTRPEQPGWEEGTDTHRGSQGANMANAEMLQRQGFLGGKSNGVLQTDVVNAESQFVGTGLCEKEQARKQQRESSDASIEGRGWWDFEPSVGRVADGVAARVDRLAAIGDGQVPAVVKAAWLLLSGENK